MTKHICELRTGVWHSGPQAAKPKPKRKRGRELDITRRAQAGRVPSQALRGQLSLRESHGKLDLSL